MSYFYGPVYSRRLGFSLGVDLLPGKVCSFECVYCHVGKTSRKTLRRFSYVNLNEFKKELGSILRKKIKINYITFSGSGEPTLHKDFDRLILAVKTVSGGKYPVCVITNSSLLYREDVRRQLQHADLVIPSLDSTNQEIFKKINRPAEALSFEKYLEGILKFSREYKGRIWLEIMIIKNKNDSKKSILKFKSILARICPEQIHLNIPVRPTVVTTEDLMPGPQTVERFKQILGGNCRVILSRPVNCKTGKGNIEAGCLMESLKRRPQSIDDLAYSLDSSPGVIEKYLDVLVVQGKVGKTTKDKKQYFYAV